MRDETVEGSLLNIRECRFACPRSCRDSTVKSRDKRYLNGVEKWNIENREKANGKVENDRWVIIEVVKPFLPFLWTKTMGQWINEASEKASLGGVQNGGYLTKSVKRYRVKVLCTYQIQRHMEVLVIIIQPVDDDLPWYSRVLVHGYLNTPYLRKVLYIPSRRDLGGTR